MTLPPLDPAPVDEVHYRLTHRAALIFSGPGRLHQQISLGDAMIAVAALAVGLALFRQVALVGVIWLVLTPLALIRAHLLARRREASGLSLSLKGRVIAFLRSLLRVGITLVATVLAYGLGFGTGYWLGAKIATLVTGPASAFPPFCRAMSAFLLGTLAAALMLTFLAPRLLPIREGYDEGYND